MSLMELYLCVSPKVEEPYDPERCLDYPLQLDLDLDLDLGDDESFDVEDCKIFTAILVVLLFNRNHHFQCVMQLLCVSCIQWTRAQSLPCV